MELIIAGVLMLFFAVAGISDKHMETKTTPRPQDPLSVPYK